MIEALRPFFEKKTKIKNGKIGNTQILDDFHTGLEITQN